MAAPFGKIDQQRHHHRDAKDGHQKANHISNGA